MLKICVAETQRDFFSAIFLRSRIFVIGQNVPIELEIDGYDENATHIIAYLDQTPVGVCRILYPQPNQAILGRLGVLDEYRQNHIGSEIVKFAENYLKENNIKELSLHAQLHAKDFYTNLGYEAYGDTFEEAGITHIHMRKIL